MSYCYHCDTRQIRKKVNKMYSRELIREILIHQLWPSMSLLERWKRYLELRSLRRKELAAVYIIIFNRRKSYLT